MDPIEAARKRAARIHREIVADGGDPWQPFDIVVRAIATHDLWHQPVQAGDVSLHGCKARIDPDTKGILYGETGTAGGDALLIGHELGHVAMHGCTDPVLTHHTDPSRSAESGTAVEKLVDYGRGERREVQADLFARELVLPRSVARDRHAEGMSVADIAARLGITEDVVTQQLLDALLLPPVPDAVAVPSGGALRRDPSQDIAVAHRGSPYLLQAGPGTGKTRTLIRRVTSLIDEGVDPNGILVLTFSNKAAGELMDRLALSHPEAAASVWIGTFHAFGLDIVRRFHDRLRLPASPRLVDKATAITMLEGVIPSLALDHYRDLWDPEENLADILAAISRAKDELVDHVRYAELAEAMERAATDDATRLRAKRAAEEALVYAAYERLLADSDALDFGDLIMKPVRLMADHPQVARALALRHRHILVDEYQDVNFATVRLIAALAADEGERLWVVGDARQSIYRFRGASSFNMSRFGKEDFEGGRRGRLQVNYRSTSEIVGAFSAFAEEMPTGGGSLSSSRGRSGAGPELRKVDSKEALPQKIAEAIEEMRRAGYSYGDQAVLCTGNEKLSDFARELELQGIPVLYLGSLFERPEVKDLLSFLSVLCDPRGMGIVRLASVPCFAMSMPDVDATLSELRRSPCLPGEWDVWIDRSSMTERGRKGLAAVAAACAGFDAGSHPWTILASLLLDRSRLAAEMSEAGDVAGRTRGIAVWQLMNFLRVQPPGRGAPVPRLLERIKRLVRLRDDRDLRQLPASARTMDAVHLMTIHGAKGLEFPVVHVPGMNADTLPRPAQTPPCPPPDGMIEGADRGGIETLHAGHDEEQECLFYVAASRARDRLLLYAATQRSDGGARALSRFVDRLGEGLSRNHVQPVPKPAASVEDAVISLRVGGEMVFTSEQIGLYESCARRFFYTHVLRIGGRRTESPFMRMHEAVRVVVHGIVEGSIAPAPTALDGAMAVALEEAGLPDPDFRQYGVHARALLEFFVATRDGHRPETTDDVVLRIGADAIRVRADDLIMHSDGRRRFRRVKTGHRRSKEGTDIAAAILTLATRQAYPDAVAELVHLADGKVSEVGMKPTMLRNRQRSLEEALRHIRAGRFPTDPGTDTCPRCPAFFICGPVPEGQLSRNW